MLAALQLAAALTLAAPKAPKTDPAERVITKAAVYLAQEPSFLAKRVSSVALQRSMKVRLEGEPSGAWYYVSHKPKTGKKLLGYLHASYISDRPAAFKVDPKAVSNQGSISGNLNLAVPGFREEIAQKRENTKKDAKSGYATIAKHMPLVVDAKNSAKLSWPADPQTMLAFSTEGRLRDPAPVIPLPAPMPAAAPAATAEEATAEGEMPAATPEEGIVPVPQPSGPPSDPAEWGGP